MIQDNPTISSSVNPSLYWDNGLQRLYIGISVTTSNTAPGDGAKAVVVGQVNSSGVLTFFSILPNSALINGETDKIVAVTQDVNQESVTINKVKVLHASTGPTYLIVNGGNGSAGTVGNTVYALPLVDLGDPTNVNQGLLANKNNFNPITHRFEVPATSNNDLTGVTDQFANVGAGPLPIQNTTSISDMVVVGDTVYVSTDVAPTSLNDTGIFFSQALFDEGGKIIRWTPWSKRAFPFNGFPTATTIGPVFLFDVDAVNGTIWAVNDANQQGVRLTAWDDGIPGSNSLAATINEQTLLNTGAYSVLDLDQSTRGFVPATAYRYALFGGPDQVAFALTSQSEGTSLDSPQTITTNYSLPGNFLLTGLPPHAGAVTVMEYSRQLTGSPANFFYAGTNTGLFVFCDENGNGFDVANLNTLNNPPFTTFAWRPVYTGSIVDIKTTGNSLYVLTYQSTAQFPMLNTLYRFDFSTNAGVMFSHPIIIAQTGSGVFSNTLRFYGIQIISTSPGNSSEQVVLATSNGLYQSSRIGGVQSATSELNANWILVDDTSGTVYNGIGYMDNASIEFTSPSTVWPFNITDLTNCKIFNTGQFHQLAGSHDALPFEFVPVNFQSIDATNPAFTQFNQLNYFWSDGARRFMIMRNDENFDNNQNNLVVFPYDTIEWNVKAVEDGIIENNAVNPIETFYWVRTIGATGIILAGTNKGVLALE